MPWSPIPKFPDIIEKIKNDGFKKQVSFEKLRVEVMRFTHSIKSKTIADTIRAMQDLGYIRETGKPNIFDVCQKETYDFGDTQEKYEKEADKVLNKLS